MALFNGTENFVPAFEGQRTALQAGSQLQHGLAQGMAFGLRKREMDAEERQRMEQLSALGKMTGFVKEGAPIPSKDTNFNVSAATHLINKFVEDPSWLVNPYTSKVATAMAGTAAEVVKLHLDGMRIKAASEAETGGTLTANRVGSSLLKLAEGGDEGADWASQWYALGEGGQPRYKDPANWETILKGYRDRSVAPGEFPDTVQMEDGTVLQGLRNPKTGVFKVHKTPKSESDEYTVKEFDGHKFLTGSGFKPIPLNSLTPEGKIDAQVQIETLRSLRKMTEDASDPEERKNLIQRQQNVLKVLKDITSGGSATTTATTAPEKVRVKGPNGQTGTVPKGATLPEGWTLE